MKTRIVSENTGAERLLPPSESDNSGIGVNYTDAYVKTLNVELEDGRKVACKRHGLKIVFEIGDSKGEALMRRIEHGPDPREILRKALEAAAEDAGTRFVVEDRVVYLDEESLDGSES